MSDTNDVTVAEALELVFAADSAIYRSAGFSAGSASGSDRR